MPTFEHDRVVKTHPGTTDELLYEAAGLQWLAEAEADGGIRCAKVFEASRTCLVEERIFEGPSSPAAARRIGTALAHTHAAGAPWFGCPPPGCPHATGIGRAATPYVARDQAASSWGAFFAEHRIMYYVRILYDRGVFGDHELGMFRRIATKLVTGAFDAPEPALVERACAQNPAITCARLHGDLWAGNVLYLADTAAATGGALIDPMAYGGHAETDLAMLQLFGYPYLEEVLAGYNDASPLADGWRERVGLHQLAPLLLHCVLFGGGYVPEAISCARRYL